MGSFTQSDTALEWRGGHEIVRVEPWGRNSLRIRGTLWQSIQDDLPGALLDGAAHGLRHPDHRRAGHDHQRRADRRDFRIRATAFPPLPMAVSCCRRRRRTSPGRRRAGTSRPAAARTTSRCCSTPGTGSASTGSASTSTAGSTRRAPSSSWCSATPRSAIPFLVSNLGYGLLWNHPGIGRVELGVTVTRWVSEATRQWDYWITAADDPADLLRQYGEAAGRTPMLPEWASGFWQCKLRYKTQDELLGIAREYKRRGLPALGHRRRLLPLDAPGRLEVRPGGVARSRGDGRGTGPARRAS